MIAAKGVLNRVHKVQANLRRNIRLLSACGTSLFTRSCMQTADVKTALDF